MTSKGVLWSAAGAIVAAAAALAAMSTASLPRRDGEAFVPGLSAPVTVELDAAAIPRIRAKTLEDAYRAQGFLHAQERFFQMDLSRRSAAGELAELVGPAALPIDRERRAFQFRKRARALAESLPARHLAWLAAYADGVNAGLADLGARPPEYWLLRARPEPWTVEDSLLVVYAFYTMLSNNEAYERPQAVMEATLAPDVYAFLTPSTARFDRPLFTSPDDPTGGYRPQPIPSSAPAGPAPDVTRRVVLSPPAGGASNQWAVGAAHGAGGVAIVANDPHLGLRLPNVFHRAELYFGDRVLRGVGIPGVPGVVIGATDGLAWGLTVSNADQSDWVVVEIDPDDPSRYRVPGGTEAFTVEREVIAVRGRDPENLDVRLTRWGPVVAHDGLGRPLALRATWLEPDGVDVDVLELAFADSVREGLDVVTGWAGPSLNWMFADADGRIGWAVNGPLPVRSGFDGSAPRSWASGAFAWSGFAEPPRYEGGPDDVLFTANNRTLRAEDAARLGRVSMPPYRAKRIADLLASGDRFDEAALAAMQLDTRVEAYDAIRQVALEVLDEHAQDAAVATARAAVAAWDGHAEPDDVGFRVLDAFYDALLERLLVPLLAPALEADPTFVYRWPLADEAMRRLLDERPAHLVPEGYADWEAYLEDVLVDALRELERSDAGPDATWGEVNRLAAAHPLAGLPLVGPWLRLPDVPQAGAPLAVRVAEPSRGAVIRMVVSPARPEAGILELAGGQSGHPLSRQFDDQWQAWHDGAPAPFLAGETVSTVTLSPAAADDAHSSVTRSIDGGS
ncbi:MAG TPA: penicillin acylase family protein [Gammaproteobacteria bacterium]